MNTLDITDTAAGVPVRDSVTPLSGSETDRPAPTWHRARVLASAPHGRGYHLLRLEAPSIARTCRAGQFVMLTAARDGDTGPVLPRPMAVYSRNPEAGTLDIVLGVVGDGTRRLASFRPGERMLVVGPLGQGFRIAPRTRRVLLVGRGIGTCSLTTVAQECAGTEVEIVAVASGRSADRVVGADVYRAAGVTRLHEVTDDTGSSDVTRLRAMLTADLDQAPPQQILTCGSERLARLCEELGQRWASDVQVSLEAHMACGLGYCHGCATGTRSGPEESPLICADGPVFRLTRPDTDR
ncbi:dihydroorotate oxidase electron transfer subunit [Streptomyces castrisilvae]|uniref:Dihydroorotate oxidase electron transfer subunit n=1 Tax=Streptomyces castrisilvae TaxID=3033811 RepID=A0ABY9HM41_9ACTN|nr:dihydroorotate oxidase electron transfer subunit [Streptomyces sp. Mut1]WLQ35434.1 dihydroorotate oxidase electron transfer subunit [Streptomyces sp. Mut1]